MARATIHGRAFVVPSSTGNRGEGNVNNFSANGRASSTTLLVAVSAVDGAPVDPTSTRVTVNLPNWLRVVMYFAGNNDELSRQLPAQLHVPVVIDPSTRRIVGMDVDGAAHELAAHRAVARQYWLETEAPLAGVRGAIGLPRTVIRALRRVPAECEISSPTSAPSGATRLRSR